ncbi:MAG: tripartite tricarboxylate transporter TctB family protein [Hyphomicrobiales bacterium]|jgi:putative tricarboxylic transport membrane protein|nr:tripartite tricarboxylate transporter TctB family protein [Hyphomicrobiales bacterium]
MRVNDLISGALLIILAAAMMAYTTTFPPFPGQKYGPSLFPRLLGGAIVLCGMLLMLRGRKQLAAGQPLGFIDDAYRPARGWMSVMMIIGAIVFYIAFSGTLGFVVTAFILMLALLLWFNGKPLNAVIIAIVAVLAVDWFFGWMFRVPLPLGVLPNGPANMLMNLVRGAR